MHSDGTLSYSWAENQQNFRSRTQWYAYFSLTSSCYQLTFRLFMSHFTCWINYPQQKRLRAFTSLILDSLHERSHDHEVFQRVSPQAPIISFGWVTVTYSKQKKGNTSGKLAERILAASNQSKWNLHFWCNVYERQVKKRLDKVKK